ncbi:disintegrin and metalloproteinase domain-containing protein 9-like [Rhinatrema bivittatum]|uniref:disintegrin and metalloproteinase domain-containing protein 9-like n=1 Tax=Rhinatrema bivittatum TaxID=194408 RepID=UPI001126B269|nr:disintegrin and metalloproteinase domain-containing protein 9-like [Rhinatrema bivittatum]
MSYAIKVEGRTYIMHLAQNRASLSPNFTVFTYNDEGEVLVQQPYIRNDCYYQGVVEGIKDSVVALSTCSGLRGFLQTKILNYGIQPIESSSSFQHLIYRITDMDAEASMCGIKSDGIPLKLDGFNPTKYRTSPAIQAKKRYIEVVLVVDYEWYIHSKNETEIHKDMISIINQADAMYNQLNTDVMLLGLEIWTKESLINIAATSKKVLGYFSTWRDDHLRRRLHSDITVLVLKRKYGISIGLAYIGKICTRYLSVAFISSCFLLTTLL